MTTPIPSPGRAGALPKLRPAGDASSPRPVAPVFLPRRPITPPELPNEMWRSIFSMVDEGQAADYESRIVALARCCRLSKRLTPIAQTELYRHLQLELTSHPEYYTMLRRPEPYDEEELVVPTSRVRRLQATVAVRPHLAQHCRCIVFNQLRSFEDVLFRMPSVLLAGQLAISRHVTKLEIHGFVPEEAVPLLEAIEAHRPPLEELRLRFHVDDVEDGVHFPALERVLRALPTLKRLYVSNPPEFEDLDTPLPFQLEYLNVRWNAEDEPQHVQFLLDSCVETLSEFSIVVEDAVVPDIDLTRLEKLHTLTWTFISLGQRVDLGKWRRQLATLSTLRHLSANAYNHDDSYFAGLIQHLPPNLESLRCYAPDDPSSILALPLSKLRRLDLCDTDDLSNKWTPFTVGPVMHMCRRRGIKLEFDGKDCWDYAPREPHSWWVKDNADDE
ncbi:hypothetical protein MNV49_003913 [Pseudohyphozyma bogoriensis]|nr:hypothetical protein MNV49_003913 [Pseudohyphozyma bogoriensis]